MTSEFQFAPEAATARPPIRQRRAKILATIGPASRSLEVLRTLFLEGVDTFRLNFSHGSHDDHREVFTRLRAFEAEFDRARRSAWAVWRAGRGR